jgi:hypothetical protein
MRSLPHCLGRQLGLDRSGSGVHAEDNLFADLIDVHLAAEKTTACRGVGGGEKAQRRCGAQQECTHDDVLGPCSPSVADNCPTGVSLDR